VPCWGLAAILIFALSAVTGAVLAQEPMRNQEQLEEKVSLYWAALVDRDYRAVYDMYPPYTLSLVTYYEWLQNQGMSES
jgi:hypothetical protein